MNALVKLKAAKVSNSHICDNDDVYPVIVSLDIRIPVNQRINRC